MPTKTTKKQKFLTANRVRWIKGVLAVLLAVVLMVYGVVLWFLVSSRPLDDNRRVAMLIVQAVERVNRPLPVDAPSGKVYFANARLSLPAVPAELGQLGYLYNQLGSSEMSDDELSLVSLNDIAMRETSYSKSSIFCELARLTNRQKALNSNRRSCTSQSLV